MTRSTRTHRRRIPRFDGLEGRRLMAGNVTVAYNSAGALCIDGDGYDNAVGLRWGYGDNVIIYSLDNLTTINGQQSQFFYQYDTDIKVKLNGGNDRLQVDNDLVTDRDLQVWGGAGNDEITVGKATIKDDLKIYPGGGFDLVELRGTTVGGAGVNSNLNDLVFLDDDDGSGLRIAPAADGTPTTIERDATIDVGYYTFDDPWVEIGGTSIGGDLTVNGHSNNPSSSLLLEVAGTTVGGGTSIASTYGPDQIRILDSVLHDLSISTGNHEDEVVLRGLTVRGLLSADLGSNADTLVIEDSTIYDADVHTGSGNDTVSLSRVHFSDRRSSSIALDGDSDSITLTGVTTAGTLVVDGGEDPGGGDRDSIRLYDSGPLLDRLTRLGFESYRRYS